MVSDIAFDSPSCQLIYRRLCVLSKNTHHTASSYEAYDISMKSLKTHPV